MTGLRPNSLYHFKLRYCGPRSNSLLSDPLVIMTGTSACQHISHMPTQIYSNTPLSHILARFSHTLRHNLTSCHPPPFHYPLTNSLIL